jgi:NADH:ubiquinone reductase (H+-translocating)
VLDPVGVGHIAAEVTAIEPGSRTVATSCGTRAYDRLVIALGSRVVKPQSPVFVRSASTLTPTMAQ